MNEDESPKDQVQRKSYTWFYLIVVLVVCGSIIFGVLYIAKPFSNNDDQRFFLWAKTNLGEVRTFMSMMDARINADDNSGMKNLATTELTEITTYSDMIDDFTISPKYQDLKSEYVEMLQNLTYACTRLQSGLKDLEIGEDYLFNATSHADRCTRIIETLEG